MNHIKIIVNEGGVVSGVLASPEIAKELLVEVIDFCTDDTAEINSAEKRYEFAKEMMECGKLEPVW